MRSPCPWFLLRRVSPEQTRQGTPTHRCDAEDAEIVVPKVPAGATLGGYLETVRRIDVRPDSVQVSGETLPHCGCPPVSLVWLSHGLRPRRTPLEERLEGVCSAQSSGALLVDRSSDQSREAPMTVIIGMDPHKSSATIEVVDERGRALAWAGTAPTSPATRRCSPPAAGSPTGSGRWRGATASVGTSPTGWCTTARSWSTCRRSCRLRYACSPPATAVRATLWMPTPWRWSRCAPRTWCRYASTRTCR